MNRDELSVYADQLQIEGDVRGEIIALELLDRPDLDARRDALMVKWLGFDPRGWRGVRIRHGFVACTSAQLEPLLATPAAPFLRSVFVTGNNTEVVNQLRLVASAPRRWLARLSITTGRRFAERRALRESPLVDDALAAALVAATPALEDLDVTGSRVLGEFPHPAVQRVRAVGYDAVCAIAEAGAPLPSVRSLFYAFAHERTGRMTFAEHGLPHTLLARATLPALTELDLSANELQRSWDNEHVAVFELLSELGVVPQLAHLRLPHVGTDDERAAVEHVRTLTRAEIEVTSDRPRPLHDLLDSGAVLAVRVRDHAHEHRISMRRLGELMSAGWPSFDDDTRRAWFALWRELLAIPFNPDYFWDEDAPATHKPVSLLADPLASLDERVDDDFAIAELAAVLAQTSEAQLAVRRHEY